jgi:hypothetical protein
MAVFVMRVPPMKEFVHETLSEMFFLHFEDIFKMNHMQELDLFQL